MDLVREAYNLNVEDFIYGTFTLQNDYGQMFFLSSNFSMDCEILYHIGGSCLDSGRRQSAYTWLTAGFQQCQLERARAEDNMKTFYDQYITLYANALSTIDMEGKFFNNKRSSMVPSGLSQRKRPRHKQVIKFKKRRDLQRRIVFIEMINIYPYINPVVLAQILPIG